MAQKVIFRLVSIPPCCLVFTKLNKKLFLLMQICDNIFMFATMPRHQLKHHLRVLFLLGANMNTDYKPAVDHILSYQKFILE